MPRKAKTRKTTKRKTTNRTTVRKTTTKRKPAKRRATARKAAPRRTTKTKASSKKKAPAKKTVVIAKRTAPKAAKRINVSGLKQAYTKSQIMGYLAECTELTKKDIANIFDALGNLMEHHLKARAPGEFTVPGLMKCIVKRKPATKARKGINPFTGEPMTFKAKPARNIVRVRPLKKLKEMVK